MKACQIRIELLSDMCVSDGGVYNSAIDTDICYDRMGFPYIPAKRIKGCLRECALELKDWGKEIDIDDLFGKGGVKDNAAKIRIDDAYIDGYKEYVEEITSSSSRIYHPQNVLDVYSYIRTQTAIDEKTGIAKQGSLRTTRVVNKGEVFYANVSIDARYYDTFAMICKCFRNIGINRTRGLGEIKVTLIEKEESNQVYSHAPYISGNVLNYNISLLEPMICKSYDGGENRSLDYIEGSKIIGLLSNQINDNEKLCRIIDNPDVFFSNAYISQDGIRYTEVPAYVYSIKNNSKEYVNKLYANKSVNDDRQLNAMKHCYVSFDEDGRLQRKTVAIEQRYHHSRPSDKSVGRALSSEESKFYQLSSINEGQVFSGMIWAPDDVLKEIYEYLSKVTDCTLGYGRSSEYGKCKFEITGTESTNFDSLSTDCLTISLNSPMIVYNNKAMYSTDKNDLLLEILYAVGLNENDIEDIDTEKTEYYLKYTSIGGYNVTWNRNKPVVSAFDKGTGLKLVFKSRKQVSYKQITFAGERNTEGYGEISISESDCNKIESENVIIPKKRGILNKDNCSNHLGNLGSLISNRLFEDYVRVKATEMVTRANESMRPTVSNMLLMLNTEKTIEEVANAVKDRYEDKSDSKKNKAAIANNILKTVNEKAPSIVEMFNKEYGICGFSKPLSEVQYKLLKAYLISLKYAIRSRKQKEGAYNE